MVFGMCPGYNPTMTPHASPSRKLHIDPAKNYSSPLKVETSVEYDLPAHIYPPKGSEPILIIHPGFVPRARSRAVITPTPTTMVATSGAIKPLATLQQQGIFPNSVSRTTGRSSSSCCPCGKLTCNYNSLKSASAQNVIKIQRDRNVQNVTNVKSLTNNYNEHIPRSINSRDMFVISDSRRNGAILNQKHLQQMIVPSHLDRKSLVRLQHPSTVGTSTTASTTSTSQQFIYGVSGRCRGACCNPRPATIAPSQAEFVAPGLAPSLLAARTPPRGPTGGSPKMKGARSRRGLAVAGSVHLPDYMTMGSSRSSRVTESTANAHIREPRVPSTSMDVALIATPAPSIAHQNMTSSLTTSLDLARAYNISTKPLFPSQQQQTKPEQKTYNVGLTASLGPPLPSSIAPLPSYASMGKNSGSKSPMVVKVADLSRDSGCSTGGDFPLDCTSGRTRGQVDSGFSTPVDISMSEEFVKDMLSLTSWRDSLVSSAPAIGSVPTSSSLLSGASSHHQSLPQPVWNLVY